MSADPGVGRQRRGAAWLLLATVISGGSGYLIMVLAGAAFGARDYEPFAFFWSTLYLVVAAASGIQQEFARATSPASDDRSGGVDSIRLRSLGVAVLITAIVIGLGIWATGPLWAPLALGSGGAALAPALSVGVAGYVVVAVISGLLSGVGAWRAVAIMTISDGVLRLAIVAIALAVGDPALTAWAVVVPFAVVPLIAMATLARRWPDRFRISDSWTRLLRNAGLTVAAATAIGLLVSGLPALLRATSPDAAPGDLAGLVLAVNLVRAPLIIAVLALQSYLVVMFRQAESHRRLLASGCLLVVAATGALAVASAVVGPSVVRAIGGPGFDVAPSEMVLIVLSGGVVGLLAITGASALAAGMHRRYAIGWGASATASAVALALLPAGDLRLGVALVLVPLIGCGVHLARAGRSGRARAPEADQP
jgi:O-antigen/teichoic acid export membrane protein